jgi:hypothetical protein
MQEGSSWQEAARLSGIQTSRFSAYRWFQQFRTQAEAALHDGRHGHIAKMHKPIRAWLEARCRKAAKPAKLLSSEGAERSLRCAGQHHPSQSHPCGAWNGAATRSDGKKIRTKAQHLNGTGKTGPVDSSWSPLFMRPDYLPTRESAIAPCLTQTSHPHFFPSLRSQRSLLLTLLFLNAVGLRRTRDEASLHRRSTRLVDRKAQSVWLLANRALSHPPRQCWRS